jgi:hypothetical protein
MRLIGFNFTKISAERLKDSVENLKFNNKMDITSINPLKSDFLKIKEDVLKVEFAYSVLYEPEFAKIEFKGEFLLAVDPKLAREVLKGWKDKETSEEFRIFIFNIILRKSNIKSLELEEDLNLPFHLPLPSLNKDSLKEKKE